MAFPDPRPLRVLVIRYRFIGDTVLHWEHPTLLQRTDLGAKLYPALRDGLVSGSILGAIAFAILCVLLVRNARKRLEA